MYTSALTNKESEITGLLLGTDVHSLEPSSNRVLVFIMYEHGQGILVLEVALSEHSIDTALPSNKASMIITYSDCLFCPVMIWSAQDPQVKSNGWAFQTAQICVHICAMNSPFCYYIHIYIYCIYGINVEAMNQIELWDAPMVCCLYQIETCIPSMQINSPI